MLIKDETDLAKILGRLTMDQFLALAEKLRAAAARTEDEKKKKNLLEIARVLQEEAPNFPLW